MYTQSTALQKIHVRNLFKIFIPFQGQNNFNIRLNTTPVFGVVIYDKDDASISYEYQLHMLLRERNYTQGIETESDVVGCFSWAKRNAAMFQIDQNSNNLEGLLLRVKVNHGIFDFRKTSRQLIRIVVNFHAADQFVHQGTSPFCKLLPKKRKADKSSENTETEIAIAWPNGDAPENELQYPLVEQSSIDISPPTDSAIEVYESPDDARQIMPNLFGQPLSQEVEFSNVFNMPESEANSNYMVLYNGNAEVVGNFRALNFYKASDINIKEDVRLLMEDHDPRDVILKIDGVEYKFKDNVQHSTNKRFVGYIAQQIESVVPEAVQLIDGILHVDYESLIPYLSESIKQNFNDIQGLKSDTEKLESLLDSLYEQFTKGENSVKSQHSTPKHKSRQVQQKSRGFVKSKWPWLVLLLVLVGAVALGVGLVAKFRQHPDEIKPAPLYPNYEPPSSSGESTARTALKAFYESMDGDNWIKKTNWMSDVSVCQWYGITCKELEEEVSEVRLPNNNLTGGLLGQELLYKVPSLTVVDLSQNNIEFHVTKLSMFIRDLNLADNKITTDVEVFNQLTFIRSLNLANNYGIYGEFSLSTTQLARLKEINVSHTSISSVAHADGNYEFDVCDWTGTALHCPVPDWFLKCGAKCL